MVQNCIRSDKKMEMMQLGAEGRAIVQALEANLGGQIKQVQKEVKEVQSTLTQMDKLIDSKIEKALEPINKRLQFLENCRGKTRCAR